MPMRFDIQFSKDLAIFTVTGKLTPKDTLEVLGAYFQAGLMRFEIIDVTKGEAKNFTLKQMDEIIEWAEINTFTRPEDSKTVFIVPEDADYETRRFFQLLTEFNRADWAAKVVHSLFEAYEWLDLPPDGS